MEKKSNIRKTLKISCIVLAIVIIAISLTGNILTTKEGGYMHLTSINSFRISIFTIGFSLYLAIKNKNSNITIILSLLMYAWTFFAVGDLIKDNEHLNITVEPFFHIYLSSALFLIISFFFNGKGETTESISKEFQELNNGVTDELNKNDFLFANFVLGVKEIPLNTEILLVNNSKDNSMDLIYAIDNNNTKTIKLPLNTIKNISYKNSMRMQNSSKKVGNNEAEIRLLTAILYNSRAQAIGNRNLTYIFDEITNNYDKVNFSVYYEITIEVLMDSIETRFVLNSNFSPKDFIERISNKI